MTAAAAAALAADRPQGIWRLAGDRLIIADADGPATILVPSESVRLMAVDLPLPNRARRLEALPFAVEDRIAEPLDAVHLALGTELAPRRFLVGVVRHERMAEWIALAEAEGLDQAAIVPDALALPTPPEGEWAVLLEEGRALVRAGDGTGFAVPKAMLRTACEAAGKPGVTSLGAPLPEIGGEPAAPIVEPLAERLARPALDLRQGSHARRRAALPSYGRKLFWILAIGIVAHAVIAAADTLMLRAIADRRADETRALVAVAAPGAPTPEEGLADAVTELLPEPRRSSAFLPLVTQVSGALAPLSSMIAVRSMRFEGEALVVDLDPLQSGVAGRITSAMNDAEIRASVTESADGAIRVTASGA